MTHTYILQAAAIIRIYKVEFSYAYIAIILLLAITNHHHNINFIYFKTTSNGRCL